MSKAIDAAKENTVPDDDAEGPARVAVLRRLAESVIEESGARLAALSCVSDEALEQYVGAPLRDTRPGELSWWLLIARSWRHAGADELFAVSVLHAAGLVRDGMAAAWPELVELADLLVSEPVRVTLAGDDEDPLQQQLPEPESAEGKIERLSWQLRRSPEPSPDDDLAQSVERRLMAESSIVRLTLDEQWFTMGEYRILVELFLLRIAEWHDSSWIEGEREGLVHCGRALLRCGDRSSAYACFYLAMAHHEVPQHYLAELDDEVARTASTYLNELHGDRPRGGPHEPLWLFLGGLQLTRWLIEHRLEALVVRFGDARPTSDAVRARGVHWRDQQEIAARCGWLPSPLPEQAPDSGVRLLLHRPAPLSPAARRFGLGDQRIPEASPSSLGRLTVDHLLLGRPDPPADAVSVPLGLAEGGGVAVLPVGPGTRIRILGAPASPSQLASIGGSVAAAGWAVIWLRTEGRSDVGSDVPSDAAGDLSAWHRMGCADSAGDGDSTEAPWAEMLGRSAVLRAVLADGLATLPVASGSWSAAATRCARAVANCFDPGSPAPAFPGLDAASVWAAAVQLVHGVAGIRVRQPVDLQACASLIEHTRVAIRAVARGMATTFEESRVPSAEAAGPRVLLDFPTGPGEGLDLSAHLLLGSLAPLLPSGSRAVERGAVKDIDLIDTDDFKLDVTPRSEVSELDELMELARRAEQPRPPAPAEEIYGGVWEPLRPSITGRKVCFLISGRLSPAVRRTVDRLTCGAAPSFAVVHATQAPHSTDLQHADDYDHYIAGTMRSEFWRLLPYSAGVELMSCQLPPRAREATLWLDVRRRPRTRRYVQWADLAEDGARADA